MNKLVLARELSVAELKNYLVDLALRLLTLIAIPILAASLARAPSIGLLPVMIVQIAGVLALVLVTLFRQKMSIIAKSFFITAILFLVGAMGVWNFGLSGNGVPFLITTIVIASILFSIRIAISIFLTALLIIVAHMFMVLSGDLTYTIDVGSYGYLRSTWIAFLISFAFLCVLLLFFLGRFSEFFFDMVANLEQHVSDSTIELERIGQAKSEFLANMSHEIRTPMNGVLGMLGLLLKSELDENQLHKTKLAKSSAESLLTLIDDVLDYSKIEAGKIDLEIARFELREVIEDLSNIAALTAQEKGLELILDTSQIDHSTVLGDAGRVRQILTNLIGNAIKFTSVGEVFIQAKTELNEENKLTFSCCIEDTGLGIREDKISSLFDRFTQVDTSTTRKFGGTGLGLSICKKLCLLMNGEITVSSVIGEGSKFEFYLTLLPGENTSLLTSNDISLVHALVVDDNDRYRSVLSSQLESSGIQVCEAASGQEALALINQHTAWPSENTCNIAIIDIEMPTMGGFELVKEIRSNNELRDVIVVMMSPLAFTKDSNTLRELNIANVVPKPVSASTLVNMLNGINRTNQGRLPNDSVSPVDVIPITSLVGETAGKPTLLWPEGPSPSPDIMTHDPSSTRARLLLVEDNRINQFVALGILEDFGVSVEVAANGVEALAALKSSSDPFELILMDCQMPEMDGYEATRRIRSGDAGATNQKIPIVAMTANAMKGDREKCLAAGMDDYLAKPIEPRMLLEKLQQWLELNVAIDP